MTFPAWADQLSVVFPPTDYQTTAERIFFIGTAPPIGKVSVNNQVIERSPAGHFSPSFPLQMGDNLFTIHYQHQQVQINVKRLSTAPEPPVGLAFGKNSLIPSVDIARLPGELICFSAIAPANATVTVQLGNQTIPLLPQSPHAQLPANCAALTGQVLQPPSPQSVAAQYQGCTTVGTPSLNLGEPQFRLTLNGKTTTQTGSGKIQILSPAQLDVVEVTADGVARTGPGNDYSRLTPLPKGTRATVTGREGEWLRLDYGGWINSKETTLFKGVVPPRSLIRSISVRQALGATEVVFPLQVPVPISVQQGDRTFTLTLYNTTAQTDIIRLDDDPLISRLDWQQSAPSQVQYTFNFKSSQQWGYKLKYEGTSLVLTLRHSPGRVGEQGGLGAPTEWGLGARGERGAGGKKKKLLLPLSGIKILLDPGHGGTETGALGPTGYPEKDLNLIVAKLVQEQLLARGATVYMTREEDRLVSLVDRLAMINQMEPAIAISIHHNSLPDEGDAMRTQGFSAFWYNTQGHSLASFLNNFIVRKLNRPSYGLYWDNLALTRPTVAPSVLLELGFMSNPVEFESLMNPQEQRDMALAIADGITQWFIITQ